MEEFEESLQASGLDDEHMCYYGNSGNTILHTACVYSNDAILHHLLTERKMDPNDVTKDQFTPLQIACL